ncbi:MAG: hypothetical protein WBH01_04475 [Dehalococcoidia bacterium]
MDFVTTSVKIAKLNKRFNRPDVGIDTGITPAILPRQSTWRRPTAQHTFTTADDCAVHKDGGSVLFGKRKVRGQ